MMGQDAYSLNGPVELIERLLDGRAVDSKQSPNGYGAITDGSLGQLVKLAYFASQSVEEGRYSKFRIYVAPASLGFSDDQNDSWQLGRFTKPIALREVDDLKRLAPCAGSHDFALEVQEQANELWCVGIRLAHSGEGSAEVLSIAVLARHMRPGLMIRVDGPGALRVSEAQRAWDLRAGGLADLGSLPAHPLPRWLDALAKRLAPKARLETHVSKMVFSAWNELLHFSSEAGRGACFVILPQTPIDAMAIKNEFEISLKYPTTNMGLGSAVADFVNICKGNPTPNDAEQWNSSVNEWLKARYALLSLVESLARFSGVDGCTVFDSNLNLVGFGGKILVSAADHKRRLRDAIANKFLPADVTQKTGTRHLSAFRLCDAHEGVSCYVVSQDGHVTAFWSHGKIVEQWKPYPAWVKRSDQY